MPASATHPAYSAGSTTGPKEECRMTATPSAAGRACGSHTCEGTVTAEAAIVLPLVGLLTLALVWMIGVGLAQVRVVDAARDAARAVARGDDSQAAAVAARRTARKGADVHITADGPMATVRVS